MIRPVYALGFSVLKKPTVEIEGGYPELEKLIADMWETMYNAKGIGLAAPQIGLSLRLFIVDTEQMEEEDDDEKGIKKVLINPKMISETGDEWAYEEGCLSIPQVTGDVDRYEKIKIEYYDEQFKKHVESYDGMNARVIQHEYDHIEGILFTERLKPLKKRLIKRKLENIKKGNVDVSYKMKFKLR